MSSLKGEPTMNQWIVFWTGRDGQLESLEVETHGQALNTALAVYSIGSTPLIMKLSQLWD